MYNSSVKLTATTKLTYFSTATQETIDNPKYFFFLQLMDKQRHTYISASVTTGRSACYCIVTLATTDQPTYNATST